MTKENGLYEVPAKLPKPVGWQLLLALPKARDKIGNVFVPQSEADKQKAASVTCLVVGMGPEAYSDPQKFPGGAWCKIGDYVIIPKYSGSRILVDGSEMRLLNDADILATTDHPASVERAF